MKTVTVREAQHNLARILRDVEAGETVEIVRRKVRVARLSPISEPSQDRVDWGDHHERLETVWGAARIEAVDTTLHDLRGPQ